MPHTNSCCNNHSDECHHHEHEKHSHCGCGCGCKKHKSDKKIMYTRIALGIIFSTLGILFSFNTYLLIFAYLLFGYDVLISGIKNIFRKHIFSEHFLMSIASLGAIALGEHLEGCFVMLLYQFGELICDNASEKSERSIKEIINIKPEFAELLKDGKIIRVSPEELATGDIVVIPNGRKIPVDGCIIEGKTQLDTASMTGEQAYRSVCEGDEVISGCINCGKVIKIKVKKTYENSEIAKVIKLFEDIENTKSISERFLTVFSKYYTPIVISIAFLTAILPPLLLKSDFSGYMYKALVFLAVSCPCALVISVPLAFFAAIGTGTKNGILFKGSLALEKLSKVKVFAFDKTGTLTNGAFSLKALKCTGIKQEVFEILAHCEYYSTHPFAEAVISEYIKLFKKDISAERISDYTEIPGQGILAIIDGKNVLVGNEKLLCENNIDFTIANSSYSVCYIVIDKKFVGYAEFSDGIKADAKEAINILKKNKIKPVMLSGDTYKSVKTVAGILEVEDFNSQLLPTDKVNILNEYKKNSFVAFTGDGINDAPVISVADVGISMGLSGSDVSIESSDIVILNDDIAKIPTAVTLSKKTMRIVWENIIFSIGIKVVIMFLGFFGIANLWLAMIGDVGVCILAIINSLRLTSFDSNNE